MNQKILIITYYWPPSGGVGVQRWMNFALQLKKKGYEPMILTPSNPQFSVTDEGLLEKVKDIAIYKVPIWEPFDLFHKLTGNKNQGNVQQGLVLEKEKRTFMDNLSVWIRGNIILPDPRIFWKNNAVKEAKRILREEKISHVITTGPPHSIHLIGLALRKNHRIKWLADFRDPWSQWDVLQQLRTSAPALFIHKRLESKVLKTADVSTTVSSRLAASLGDIKVLPNGITLGQSSPKRLNASEFTIGYFGMLNELRNPSQLWILLDKLCNEDTSFAQKLKLKIGGIVSESVKAELAGLKHLSEKVEYLGYLSHTQVMEAYQQCNMLLLLLNQSNNSKWILPVKFFEYLTAGRPILALGPVESDLGDLMKGKKIGKLIEYDDIDQIRSFILNCFENNQQPDENDIATLIKRFTHESLVDDLEHILGLKNAEN